MASGLKVIALISGGKDSLFSILHCLRNGHEVVALANLFPEDSDMEDTDSYMYQTIGHAVVPLYTEALDIPLYRAPISGGAVNTNKVYHYSPHNHDSTLTTISSSPSDSPGHFTSSAIASDETEALLPLLRKILAQHPTANALSSGAILSTYQRTRIESICTRLNLVPLAYLWQYPSLPPYTQTSLLHDIRAAGQESRIIKTASGGLRERDLWMRVGEEVSVRRLIQAMASFGGELEDGSVVGEGGEYETLTLDGPAPVWKGRIDVPVEGRKITPGEGGSWALRTQGAKVVPKEDDIDGEQVVDVRVPELYDNEFKMLLEILTNERMNVEPEPACTQHCSENNSRVRDFVDRIHRTAVFEDNIVYMTNFTGLLPPDHTTTSTTISPSLASSVATQTQHILSQLTHHLTMHNLIPSHLISTTILLRHMSDFPALNSTYGSLFTEPNPPARVTIACGNALPQGVDVILSATASKSAMGRKGLHVQSRSYWAPANIGPYAQAIAVPPTLSHHSEDNAEETVDIVHVAGQIPLVPATMGLVTGGFEEQAVLSLQHLWRVGRVMGVKWWGGGAVAFVAAESEALAKEKAAVVGAAWRNIHEIGSGGEDDEDDEEEVDIAERDLRRPWAMGSVGGAVSVKTRRSLLPDYSCVQVVDAEGRLRLNARAAPKCFVVQVDELPRGAMVEWASFGLAGEALRVVVKDGNGESECQVRGHGAPEVADFWVTWFEITTAAEFDEFYTSMERSGKYLEGLLEVYTAHALHEQLLGDAGIMIIPCRRIFDEDGTELYAAVRHRGRSNSSC